MSFEKIIQKYEHTLKQLVLAFTILARIQKCYPHVFEECTNNEELDELMGKDK